MTCGPKPKELCKRGHQQSVHRYITPSGKYCGCKLCRKDSNKIWSNKMYATKPDWQVRKHLKIKYQITLEDKQNLLKKQGGKCAICQNSDFGFYGPAVDHSHKTQSIRGILCHKCNRGLGLFNDSTEKLTKAIKYLQDTDR